MKSLLAIAFSILIGLSVSAQTSLIGVWKGKTVKNGQPMGFILKMHKNGSFTMAYDLNPNEVSVKGKWSLTDRVLSFKNSDGILHLKPFTGQLRAGDDHIISFRKKGKTQKYALIKGPFTLMGWDEGVAAVVINHEEQYSIKK
ncbi:MAG: hypothetical protein R8P61_17260 [Bacteroidia bacterium]|nr:hypothetical protein [Bacteroidia bacterium]